MSARLLTRLLLGFGHTFAVREEEELTDGDLLWRFSHTRDEAAFATLMQRHGPLVLGVCRRVLHDPNDADDAFQATFFVLARKAGSVGQPDRLANWLYGVALRVARKARAASARRQAREQPMTDLPATDSSREADWNDLRQVLDDEVQQMPEKFRLPILLCHLQGRTREEAARQLGCSAGAVKGMLERGREELRSRLMRRGVTLSATALAGLLSENALSAAVPAALRDSTIKAALLFAARTGATAGSAAALAEGVLQAMWSSRMKVVAAVTLALAVVGTGAAALALGKRPGEPGASQKADPEPKTDQLAELLRRKAAARLDLVRTAYEGYWLGFQFGRVPEQTVNLWSRRWLQAQLDLGDRKADRDAALQAHLDRLKKIDEIARARLDLGNYTRREPSLQAQVDESKKQLEEMKTDAKPGSYESKLKEQFEDDWKAFRGQKSRDVEQICQASVRWLVKLQHILNRVVKDDPRPNARDLQAHLDRIKKVQAVVEVVLEAGRYSKLDLDTVKFYRLQAEEWLAKGKIFAAGVVDPGRRGDDSKP
jgi:RNA polymerase sigma factor (sigma-70 family)